VREAIKTATVDRHGAEAYREAAAAAAAASSSSSGNPEADAAEAAEVLAAAGRVFEHGGQARQFVKAPKGLQLRDVSVGSGECPKSGRVCSVLWEGKISDGTVIQERPPRRSPGKFKFGGGVVIEGIEIGMAGMRVGGVRELIVPPHLAYKAKGSGKIPPHATLYFVVELLGVIYSGGGRGRGYAAGGAVEGSR